MKRLIVVGLLAGLGVAAPALAADLKARLYVGHGINGSDLGFAEELPVDLCTGKGQPALLTGVPFGVITADPLVLDAGLYTIEIRLTDGGTCKGALAVATTLSLAVAENATALAHLTEQGTPTVTKFVNDVRPAKGQARIVARHAAAAGDVNVFLQRGESKAVIRDLENPDQEGADLQPGRWYVAIYPASSWRHPLFETRLRLRADTASFAYAVGSPARDTFAVLLQTISLP